MENETEISTAEAIGKTVDEASEWFQQYGYSIRVTKKDGQPCIVTRDFDFSRANLAIKNGKVTDVISIG